MLGTPKDFSNVFFVFATVTLLSCCNPVSSFFQPRVTHTSDAIIIDFTIGTRFASFYQNKNQGPFNALPTFNPYTMMIPQQPMFYNLQSYLNRHPPSLTAPPLSTRQNSTTPSQNNTANGQNIQCGRGPTSLHPPIHNKITGGHEAKPNSWPFMVAVVLGGQLCGGTLISDSKILLAAQCLERLPMVHIMWYSTVWIGVHSQQTQKQTPLYPTDVQMTRRISKIVLHRQFNAVTFANDIAIITLDGPVSFSKSIAPVCLPAQSADPDQYADQEAAILGWGGSFAAATGPVNYYYNVTLQQGRVRIASNAECKNKDYLSKYVTDTTTCVHSNKRFTCPGDIGGPVVVQTSPGIWTQVGINSYTKDCYTSGLKTRVSAFRTWIDQNMQN